MREIKFRAYNKDWEMILPVKAVINNGDWLSVIAINKTTDGIEHEEWQDCEVGNEIEIMQYTDLKDKNGKEIYEGDIVRNLYEVYPVVFESGMFCINDLETPIWKMNTKDYWEVIGNIYENKDLL